MEYNQALEYLDTFANYEKTVDWEYPQSLKPERMEALSKALGTPHRHYPSVIIAGSKGKGSTAAMLSAILRMENIKVGFYSSPHLVDIRERIQVNGLKIGEQRFTDAVALIKKILEKGSWRGSLPTYFEILTAVAFNHFREMKVAIAVLEVGLGGLLDSTNIVDAKVAGITPISLEHTDRLGKTISKIAVQKCGVIKERSFVVSGLQSSEAEHVIRESAAKKEATLWTLGKDIRVVEREYDQETQHFDLRGVCGDFYNLEISLLGTHQIYNAAQAVGLAKATEKKYRFSISESAVRQGLADARWPGRLESVMTKPRVLLDGAQTPESMSKLFLAVKKHFHFQRLFLVLGVSSDKDLEGILKEALPQSFQAVATQSQNVRALGARLIAEKAKDLGKDMAVEPDAWSAFLKVKELAREDDLVLITGSLFLVGFFKAELTRHGHSAF